jgi:hypothetical protein
MIIYKHKEELTPEEKKQVISLLAEIKDVYGDFYITRNNLRLFISDNADLLFNCIKDGDYIAFDENGMAVITGFSDNAKRKYIKVLCKKPEDLNNYFKLFSYDLKTDLYMKIKKNNPLKDVLLANRFEFFGGRGKEILLAKKER